jgi:hypothetical protein
VIARASAATRAERARHGAIPPLSPRPSTTGVAAPLRHAGRHAVLIAGRIPTRLHPWDRCCRMTALTDRAARCRKSGG